MDISFLHMLVKDDDINPEEDMSLIVVDLIIIKVTS